MNIANELFEKMKAANSKEQMDALLKDAAKEMTELSIDDLDGTSGGVSATPQERAFMKEFIIQCAENDLIDLAARLLEDYFGIDNYRDIRNAMISTLKSDKAVILFIVENLL